MPLEHPFIASKCSIDSPTASFSRDMDCGSFELRPDAFRRDSQKAFCIPCDTAQSF